MAPQKTSSELPAPLRAPVTALRKVPGAGMVTKAAGGALDAVGTVSPRGRRVAVYTGAGLLGVAGVVEWPIALTVAGVAWLTQPKPGHEGNGAATTTGAASKTTASKTAASKTTATKTAAKKTAAKKTAAKRTAARTTSSGSSTARRSTSGRGSGKTTTAGRRSTSASKRTTSGGRRKATTGGG
ncbi:hypothetical protein ACIP2X_13690 [Streptomyces sp. NPDC089424]|uniref:hypothetical protein n=1 Tax=Streptomyces sp. NPDC089424 TaxID=3365917 RepID=UPI00382955D3